MGSSKVKSAPVVAEEPITPAVARSANAGSEANEMQATARSRLRGISSTYNRFASDTGAMSSKLG